MKARVYDPQVELHRVHGWWQVAISWQNGLGSARELTGCGHVHSNKIGAERCAAWWRRRLLRELELVPGFEGNLRP